MAVLEDLLKAVTELTEVTKNLLSLRTEAIESVKGAAASTPKASSAKVGAAAEAKTETVAAEVKTETVAATTDTKVYDELAASIGAYVGGTTRDDERAARKAKIKALLQHDAIKKPGTAPDVFDAANIKDDAIQVFKDNLQMLVDKGDLTEAPKSTALV